MPLSTREMFSRLIRCEAGGEGINGMRAVASSIMNRVNVAYGEYLRTGEGNLRRIMEQPYQYTCMYSYIGGQDNPQNIWTNPPEQIHYDVADWALSGHILQGVDDSLWYMNPFAANCPSFFPYNRTGVIHNRLGEHCFFIPTALYAQT
jgi:N-acetylmuramoyl-L-alanine amidase